MQIIALVMMIIKIGRKFEATLTMKNTMTSEEIHELMRDKAEPSYSVAKKQWRSVEFEDECIEKIRDKYCLEYFDSCPKEPYCNMCIIFNELKQKLEEK